MALGKTHPFYVFYYKVSPSVRCLKYNYNCTDFTKGSFED